jgi:hypothetical protein
MRKSENKYEYIAVYDNDLAIAMKKTKALFDIVEQTYQFKANGTVPIAFHLGMGFFRDKDNTQVHWDSNYELWATVSLTAKEECVITIVKGRSPWDQNSSDLFDAKSIQMYQSMIGSLQWMVTIGQLDITTFVMTMSGLRVAPINGHLERVNLSKMRHLAIWVHIDEPDYSHLLWMEHDWSRLVYGQISEMIAQDVPDTLGNIVTLTHYVDANLIQYMEVNEG